MDGSTFLACGCLRGRVACDDGMRLLRVLAGAYADAVRLGAWTPFDDARLAVEAHYAATPASVSRSRRVQSA